MRVVAIASAIRVLARTLGSALAVCLCVAGWGQTRDAFNLFYGGDRDGRNGLGSERNTSVKDSRTYDDFEVNEITLVEGLWGNFLINYVDLRKAYYEIRQGVSRGDGGRLIASGVEPVVQRDTGRDGIGLNEDQFSLRLPKPLVLFPGKYHMTVALVGHGTGRAFVGTTSGADNGPANDPNPPATGGPIANGDSYFDSRDFGYVFAPVTDVYGTGKWDFSFGIGPLRTLVQAPTAFRVTEGTHRGGGVAELESDDARRLHVERVLPSGAGRASVGLEYSAEVASDQAKQIRFTIESFVDRSELVTLTVDFFNFQVGNWERVGTTRAQRREEAFSVLVSEANRFVGPGGRLLARSRWFDGDTPRPQWIASVDYVKWMVRPD